MTKVSKVKNVTDIYEFQRKSNREKIKAFSHRALRDLREELFCRSKGCPTGKNALPVFSEGDMFALAALSARAKDRTL
jgi:hypothetical protein